MNRSIPVLCALLLGIGISSNAQTTRKVLFLGNSYTGVNNLPQLIKDVALSAGDTLIYDSYTPGGYTLEDHSLDPTSQGKIPARSWDYVVLQGQSQEPITRTFKFKQGGNLLNDSITQHSPCGVTMLYMTWGRKNGDATNCANFPVMCTYQGMDSTLRQQYLNLASAIDAEVSPVSVVWRHLRQNNPGIDLYQPDESHPSAAGSYAAACSFYTAIFKKDPTSISFDYSLNATDATIIRNAAKIEVFDSLNLWDYKQLPKSDFSYITGSGTNQVTFSPANYGVSQTYSWDFGDGTTATTPNPTHSFSSNGTYTITLTTTNCDLQGTHTSISDTTIQFCTHTPSITTTNPWLCAFDTLWTQAADSYQWFAGGIPIPETSQYLPDYQRYGSLSFSVLSTVNGCSELSEIYSANPQWSGYYFDAAYGGDPCAGDTALFVVHHINGVLSGNEVIRWYKNGQVLPMANNNDTLLITTQGKYECKVVDPNSNCPLDTTSSSEVVIDCGNLGINNIPRNESWSLYPNPASENFTVHISKEIEACNLQVYNATGSLIKSLQVSSDMSVNINTLPNGVYFIHLKSQGYPVLRLLKE